MRSPGQAAAVLLCAGSGSRMGGVNKLLRPLGGRSSLARCLETLWQEERMTAVALVVSEESRQEAERCAQPLRAAGKHCFVVPGGDSRGQSVMRGLDALAEHVPELVAIHDAARPFLTAELLARCLDAAQALGSGVAGIPVVDTLRRVDEQGGLLTEIDRAGVWRMQTPQCFRYEEICAAYALAQQQGSEQTDDAAIYALRGGQAQVVMGDVENFKLTLPGDWERAQRQCAASARYTHETNHRQRIGWGEDTHRLAAGRKLILGGLAIPFEKGLLGHSDADVLCHALSDALLGALALGDIGQHFPDTDPRYAGADSLQLLRQVYGLVEQNGYALEHADATITAEQPKLLPYIPAIRARLATALGVESGRISVKATTGEGLGPEGCGDAMTARCVLLLREFS